MARELIKTDRNGTKHYKDDTCPRCGGTGRYGWYGICFKCNGTGKFDHIVKEYTDEYKQKLEDRKMEKLRAKAEERNQKFFKAFGFNEDGYTYIVNGDTFPIKDELKDAGAKFIYCLGWHFDHPEFNTTEVHISEIGDLLDTGSWELDTYKAKQFTDKCREIGKEPSMSSHIGEVGDKITEYVTFIKMFSYENQWGTGHIYKFEDVSRNVYVWNTSTYLDLEEGQKVKITGTIKKHSEFKGELQTVLTRCKINKI